jgi:hypothetical protein
MNFAPAEIGAVATTGLAALAKVIAGLFGRGWVGSTGCNLAALNEGQLSDLGLAVDAEGVKAEAMLQNAAGPSPRSILSKCGQAAWR